MCALARAMLFGGLRVERFRDASGSGCISCSAKRLQANAPLILLDVPRQKPVARRVERALERRVERVVVLSSMMATCKDSEHTCEWIKSISANNLLNVHSSALVASPTAIVPA